MESDRVRVDSLEVKSEPKRRSLKLAIIAVVAIAVVIVAALAYMWWSPQDGTQDGTQADWYFKGAYADYEGETTYLFETINFSMRMEVADLNSTHLKLLLYMKMMSESFGTVFDEQQTNWFPINEITSFGFEEMEGYTLERDYEDHVYIEGLGTKFCRVLELTSTDVDEGSMTLTLYIDAELVWPLKVSFNMNIENQDLNFDITLTDTNIPALT